jgi:hypothetical protein
MPAIGVGRSCVGDVAVPHVGVAAVVDVDVDVRVAAVVAVVPTVVVANVVVVLIPAGPVLFRLRSLVLTLLRLPWVPDPPHPADSGSRR